MIDAYEAKDKEKMIELFDEWGFNLACYRIALEGQNKYLIKGYDNNSKNRLDYNDRLDAWMAEFLPIIKAPKYRDIITKCPGLMNR